jgi:hypothetical protein
MLPSAASVPTPKLCMLACWPIHRARVLEASAQASLCWPRALPHVEMASPPRPSLDFFLAAPGLECRVPVPASRLCRQARFRGSFFGLRTLTDTLEYNKSSVFASVKLQPTDGAPRQPHRARDHSRSKATLLPSQDRLACISVPKPSISTSRAASGPPTLPSPFLTQPLCLCRSSFRGTATSMAGVLHAILRASTAPLIVSGDLASSACHSASPAVPSFRISMTLKRIFRRCQAELR